MKPAHDPLTVAEIRRRYYGVSYDVPPRSQPPTDLTPAARFVAGQAKRRLGERGGSTARRPDEEALFGLVREVEQEEGEELSERERNAVVASIASSLEHYDILTPLFSLEGVNDIIIRNFEDISIQIGRRNVQTDLRFPDHAAFQAFVENLLKRAGKACTLATPVVDAAVDPHVRACVTHESFSPSGSGPMVTLRISRHKAISLESLVHHQLAPMLLLRYLAALVKSGAATILIAGEVGTGKTTLVRALASAIADDEAVLVIEDTHELVLERNFTRTLLTREANTEGAGRISPALAIRTGMRMAMNRIILGEMRDAETAEAFVDVCASGHAGMSTIHAKSARDALLRLELFLLRAQGNVGIETVHRQIANAISVVVYLGLDPLSRCRRVLQVLEVGHAYDGAIQLSPIFSFQSSPTQGWVREGGVSFFTELLHAAELTLPLPGVFVACAAAETGAPSTLALHGPREGETA